MRTTIRINDELYRRLKDQSVQTGKTVGSLIEDAVRAKLDRPVEPSTVPEPLQTYGGSGLVPGVDLSSNVAVREAMDEDEPLDALR